MVAIITILVFALALACYVKAVSALAPGRAPGNLWRMAFPMLALPRLGVYGFLVFKQWTGTLALHHMPLFLFLIPEAMLLPRDTTWTGPWVAGFTLLLTAGSALGAWLAVRWTTRNQRADHPDGG